MEYLAYDYGTYYDLQFVKVSHWPHIRKYNEIQWNTIEFADVSMSIVTKRVYNFILKLPKLKILRFKKLNLYWCLVTYNTKFFKHKVLLMTPIRGGDCMNYIPNIIFIL